MLMAVDPGVSKPHAFSIWKNGEVHRIGFISNMFELESTLEDIKLVAIEDQYLSLNYKTSKQLSFECGKIAGLCELRGINYKIINVAKWQNYFKLFKSIDKSVKGNAKKSVKEQIIKAYARNFMSGIDDIDLAAAVLIGAYVQDTF